MPKTKKQKAETETTTVIDVETGERWEEVPDNVGPKKVRIIDVTGDWNWLSKLRKRKAKEAADIAVMRLYPEETEPLSLMPKPSDRKSTRLNSSHIQKSRMPSSA